MKSGDWPLRAKHILKTELKRRRISYSDLADKLAAIGIDENEKNLAKKISRGSFKAVFFVQCLAAIGCESLHLISGEGPLSASLRIPVQGPFGLSDRLRLPLPAPAEQT